MKSLILLFLGSLSSFAAASLRISATSPSFTVARDGVTITVPIAGASGALSPTSGITGLCAYDMQAGSGNPYAISSTTASADTVTIVLTLPVNGPTYDAVSVSLGMGPCGVASNLTDASGNTPSATGNTGIAPTKNNSTWIPAGVSPFRVQGGAVINSNPYPQDAAFISSDGYVEFNCTCTEINVAGFQFLNHWILTQDGAGNTPIHDWGTQPSTTSWAVLGAVTGLSGTHTYQIVQISTFTPVGVGSSGQILKSIQITGTLGSQPAARPVIVEVGDSVAQPGGSQQITDSRLDHDFLSAYALGAVDQHPGWSGYEICCGQLEALGPANTVASALGSTPVVAFLEGGGNDGGARIPLGTFRAAVDAMIARIQANSPPPSNIIFVGMGSCCVSGNLSYPTYTAEIQASAAAHGILYTDTSLWLAHNVGRQSDGVHLAAAGEAVFANRYIPIKAGYLLGSSYTMTGPSSGASGSPSTNFTVSLQGGATFATDTDSVCRQTIRLSDGGNGGIFTPQFGSPGTGSLTVSPCSTRANSWTFTYTPASGGAKTITATSATPLLWHDPAPLTYTVGSIGSTFN